MALTDATSRRLFYGAVAVALVVVGLHYYTSVRFLPSLLVDALLGLTVVAVTLMATRGRGRAD